MNVWLQRVLLRRVSLRQAWQVVVQPGLLQKEQAWQELVPMVLQVQVPREL